jgi:GntR family transcriptional regulator, phosphonate transport system regulatory protein
MMMTDTIVTEPPLRRQTGVALWRQVAARLAEDIKGRRGPDEARLPSEQELARRFGVNRHTVRQAIRALAEQGLVRAEQGRGTFVADLVVDYPIGARTRFTANLKAQDRAPSRQVLHTETVPAEPALAQMLGVAAGTQVHRLRTLSSADGVPISISTVTLGAKRFPDAADELARDNSITNLFARHGVGDYRRRSTRIYARLPEAEEALLLRQERGEPVLVSEGVDIDPEGAPISLSTTVWAAERVQFVVES